MCDRYYVTMNPSFKNGRKETDDGSIIAWECYEVACIGYSGSSKPVNEV